jgi:hypothetical protein
MTMNGCNESLRVVNKANCFHEFPVFGQFEIANWAGPTISFLLLLSLSKTC